MMGRTHALSGAVAALAALPAVNSAADVVGAAPVHGPVAVAVLTVAAAGGAMLPDFDHHHATIAQSVGPITKVVAGAVGAISGGHRNGTHSFVGIAAFTALTWALGTSGGIVYGLWMAFLFAVAAAALRLDMVRATIVHTLLCLAVGAGLVAATATTFVPVAAATAGVAIGSAAHIAGDMLTRQGCPLLWPVVKTRFRVLALTTGGKWETQWLFAALAVTFVVLAGRLAGAGIALRGLRAFV